METGLLVASGGAGGERTHYDLVNLMITQKEIGLNLGTISFELAYRFYPISSEIEEEMRASFDLLVKDWAISDYRVDTTFNAGRNRDFIVGVEIDFTPGSDQGFTSAAIGCLKRVLSVLRVTEEFSLSEKTQHYVWYKNRWRPQGEYLSLVSGFCSAHFLKVLAQS